MFISQMKAQLVLPYITTFTVGNRIWTHKGKANRLVEFGRNLWVHPVQPLFMEEHLEEVALDHIQTVLHHLYGERLSCEVPRQQET